MAIATDERPASTGVQRGRGGFMRGGATGDTPYVTDPSGALVKSGPRKGLPKRLAYGSPSGRGKQLENSKALEKWGERRVVLGLVTNTDLVMEARQLLGLDPDSDDFKAGADRLVVAAKDAAEAGLAADRGTHTHALSEDSDEGRDPIARAEAGELLGIPVDAQRSLVEAWNRMLEREGLEVLAVEASCVDDTWRLAGTLDRLARTTRTLRFAMFGGEIVEIPAGTVVVLDVKTGKRRCDERTGAVMYWQSYAVQIASYAQSVPYDTEAETRGEWPWPISQDHALIAHLDVLGAIEGGPPGTLCQLVYVDLAQGRAAGEACEWAHRVWDSQNTAKSTTFSVAQLASVDVPPVTDAAPAGPPPAGAPKDAPEATQHASGAQPAAEEPSVSSPSSAATLSEPTPSGSDDVAATGKDPRFPARGDDYLVSLVHTPSVGTRAWAVEQLGHPEAEGDACPEAFKALETAYKLLGDDVKAWFRELIKDACAASVDFRAHHHKTLRRFEIYRGLIALMAAGDHHDDIVRALAAIALDSDAPLFPCITPGHAVGALDAAAAATFARLCTDFVDGRLLGEVRDDGFLRLVAA